jgi:hypothetical protein
MSIPGVDFRIQNEGSLVLLSPISEAAKQWADEHIGRDNGFQPYWPDSIVIEARYIGDILEGIQADGLAVI